MQIVIDILEEDYERVVHGRIPVTRMRNAIRNGTPLPKGHGRLCDLDAALRCVNDDSVEDCDAKWQAIGLFEWAMAKRVVIEADKEYEVKVITRGNCMICGKELDEGLFFCKECEAKVESEK